MSTVKELGVKDTIENKLFRIVAVPFILSKIIKNLNLELGHSMNDANRAKTISEILESIAYEQFPSRENLTNYFNGY